MEPRRHQKIGGENHAALHQAGHLTIHPIPSCQQRDQEPRRFRRFHLEGFMVPEHWSQVAADILAQKYFRKPACRSA